MKIKYKFGAIIAFMGISLFGNSQSTNGNVANNAYNAAGFIGWTNTNGANPLLFRTNALTRMRLNGEETHNYLGTGFPVDVKGHFGIGFNGYFQNNTPLTMLHLEGPTNVPMFTGGQLRAWMKTGMFARENSDFMYVGMKPVGPNNRSDAAIAWGDDIGNPEGPDNLLFLFNTTQNNLPGTVSPLIGNSANGYEMMRMTASGPGNENGFPAGYIGIGPLFSDANRPQNRLHINGESALPTFVQISNAPSPTIPGTGQAATDGLKLGIQNLNTTMGDRMFGYLQWQENTPFIIQTASTVAGASAATGERMRITSIGSLNNTTGGGYGGLTTPANLTRVAISSDGAAPVKSPKSLLQIGYEYGTPLASIQGYRKWMDLGMLASNNKDHVWIGLKPREAIDYVTATNDKLDAVVAWGTDRQATASTEVDNMRFVFTGHPFDANPEGAPSTSYNGLEMMRMYPASVYTHPIYNAGGTLIGNEKSYGRVGIGDFTASGVNQEPTQKLDVVGNARLRYLPDPAFARDSTVNKFVMVDESGVLRWGYAPKGTACWDLNSNGIGDTIEDINNDGQYNALDCQGSAGPMGSFGAHNGTSMSTIDTTKVAFGQDLNQTFAPGRLLSTREVPMNNFNTVFTNAPGYNGNANRLGLGTSAPTAKLDITMTPTTPYSVPIALNIFMNQASSNGQIIGQRMELFGNNTVNSGAKWSVQAGQTQSEGHLVMVHGNSTSNSSHQGIVGTCDVGGLPIFNVGVAGAARRGKTTYGGDFSATGVAGSNITAGVHLHAQGTGSNKVYGLHAQIGGSGTGTAYGVFSDVLSTTANYTIGVYSNIYGNVSTNPQNRAGYFVGPVEATGFITTPSDQQFKTNVNPLNGSLKSIQGLKPVSYYMDNVNYSQFGFDSNLQFGFIAQEVETVFPNLVHESLHPAQYDSLGVQTFPAVPYKSLNYNAMIPVNTMAIIELNQKVDRATLSDQTMKTNVQDLTGSLDKVLDMRGVSYDWDHTVNPEMNLDSVNHVGFIAQEIAQIDPRLTYLADDSLLHIEYDKVVPILAEAIEELNGKVENRDSIIEVQQTTINTLVTENSVQQATIEDLNNRLSQLENCLSGILPYLCQLSHSAIQANTPETQEEVRKNLNVTLSNRNAIVLDQNVPNPFAEQTIINFSIPETVKKAQIHFYDGNGRFMNSVEVTERGLGSVTVFGSDLSTGVYTYTLVADGQVVATKKMMKQ
jgi:hypothetical protein